MSEQDDVVQYFRPDVDCKPNGGFGSTMCLDKEGKWVKRSDYDHLRKVTDHVWVAVIDHNHGQTFFTSFHKDTIYRLVADYCRQNWSESWDQKCPENLNDGDLVAMYFEDAAEVGREYLYLEKVKVDD